MSALAALREHVPVRRMCAALGLARGSYYRWNRPAGVGPAGGERKVSPRALSAGERAVVLSRLHEPHFVDRSPAAVYATLLDEDGQYLCSVRTMYRILAENQELRERRGQLRHPQYAKPELLATAPNQVWRWC